MKTTIPYREFRLLPWLHIDMNCMRVLYLPSIEYLRENLAGTGFETDQKSLLIPNIKQYRQDWSFVRYDDFELIDISLESTLSFLDLEVYQYNAEDNTIILVRDIHESFL